MDRVALAVVREHQHEREVDLNCVAGLDDAERHLEHGLVRREEADGLARLNRLLELAHELVAALDDAADAAAAARAAASRRPRHRSLTMNAAPDTAYATRNYLAGGRAVSFGHQIHAILSLEPTSVLEVGVGAGVGSGACWAGMIAARAARGRDSVRRVPRGAILVDTGEVRLVAIPDQAVSGVGGEWRLGGGLALSLSAYIGNVGQDILISAFKSMSTEKLP